MQHTYPQETIGTTLVDVTEQLEHRRVYTRKHAEQLEVGELTRGPLTQQCFDAPAHVHCVHLSPRAQQACAQALRNLMGGPQRLGIEGLLGLYFSDGARMLTQLMDDLDAWGIAYGYLNIHVGSHVSYRPVRSA